MKDTGFTVPKAKHDRRARSMASTSRANSRLRLTAAGGATMAERPEDMEYVSGGQGLWSTLDDYLAFARMFVGAGQVDGLRLLKPETLALMTTQPVEREPTRQVRR